MKLTIPLMHGYETY